MIHESVIPSREDGEESPADEEGDPSLTLGTTQEEVEPTRDEIESTEETQLESVASDSAEEE